MGQLEDLNDAQRLAVAQTLFKMAGELVDTKNPDSLRSVVDRGYKELYEQTGSKSFDIMLNGQQVGTYSIRFSKPQKARSREDFEVVDYVEAAKWLMEETRADEKEGFIADNIGLFAEWFFYQTGELPYGCELKKVEVAASDKQYLGGTLKVDKDAVFSAMGDVLPSGVRGLLE